MELLKEAQGIRYGLGQARLKEDFDLLSKRCDDLWRKDFATDTCDDSILFLTDCMQWCNEAKLGAIEHRYAIGSIKVYIKCQLEKL